MLQKTDIIIMIITTCDDHHMASREILRILALLPVSYTCLAVTKGVVGTRLLFCSMPTNAKTAATWHLTLSTEHQPCMHHMLLHADQPPVTIWPGCMRTHLRFVEVQITAL